LLSRCTIAEARYEGGDVSHDGLKC
jgi:hypothetical protein